MKIFIFGVCGILAVSCGLVPQKEIGKVSGGESSVSESQHVPAAFTSQNTMVLPLGITPYWLPKLSAQTARLLDEKATELSPVAFKREEVGRYQVAGSDETLTPKSLQGIWWMDGNPTPDETSSFARVDFSLEKPLFAPFGANNFTFHGGLPGDGGQSSQDYQDGLVTFRVGTLMAFVYEMTPLGGKDDPYDLIQIRSTFKLGFFGIEQRFQISPSILGLTMKKVNDDLYLRETSIFGIKAQSYGFKRILKPRGTNSQDLEETEWWAPYAAMPGPKHLQISRLK